ncbi:putative MFS transporter [Setomelanomma holmii]|uniref:MFS transporter n=1 Tax=Setomelanomma holmii TaxID=210430 RepID=A0A9P4LJC7_9PLEO|nr:putative MFS transporter [Setomelanomma holmii]
MVELKGDYYNENGEQAVLPSRDWSVKVERKAKRKFDLIIIPILTLGIFCLQLDRGNIANAITDDFMEDVGITQDQFNVGQQMLSLGIVLFEIPANMAIYRVGPAFQTNYASFIATRFLLGMTESGFIPGGLWTLSTWYTRSETAKRVMIFYFGNQFGQASAKLLAYGILHMRGVGGEAGWFWLFVLMEGFTIICGFILGFFLPDSFKRPYPSFLPKWQMFADREIHILRNRRAFDTYAPSLVREFGFGQLRANAMAAVGLFLQIPVSVSFIWFSDHFNRRGETVMAGFSCHLLGYIFNRIFTEISNRDARYFGVVWIQTFGTFSHPLNITWMSLTCTDSEERALAMALVIMGINIAGIYGAQIFRADDRPRYRRAFSIACAILAFGLVIAIVRYIDDRTRKRRKARQLDEASSSEGEVSAALPPSDMVPAPIVDGRKPSIRACSLPCSELRIAIVCDDGRRNNGYALRKKLDAL